MLLHINSENNEDSKYDMNDSFEAQYVNDKSPENHFKIDVRHLKNKINIKVRNIQEVYKLKDGQKAIYTSVKDANILVFEKGNWQYMISIDKRVSNKVTPDILVDIANSIDYTTK